MFNEKLTTSSYITLGIFGLLTLLGTWLFFSNKLEDGLLSIFMGLSIVTSFVPFNYSAAKSWQKMLVAIYAILVCSATAYFLYTVFKR